MEQKRAFGRTHKRFRSPLVPFEASRLRAFLGLFFLDGDRVKKTQFCFESRRRLLEGLSKKRNLIFCYKKKKGNPRYFLNECHAQTTKTKCDAPQGNAAARKRKRRMAALRASWM
jgi:hypothetical protein